MKCFLNRLFVLVLLFCIALSAQSNSITDHGWHEFNIDHNDLTRYFRYYVPKNLAISPDTVLLFHGGTQSMRKIFRKRAGGSQEWETLAERNGFLLLVPNGVNPKTNNTKGDKQNWNDCRPGEEADNASSTADDVGFVAELLLWAKIHFKINELRVYATGASNGGMMTLRLITELSNKIAAAAVFIANQPVNTDCKKPTNPVPLFIMSATKDPLVPWEGGKIRDKGPTLMSANETLNYWLIVNRADKSKVHTKQLPDINNNDKSVVIKNIYPKTSNGGDVWFYEVRGGGHTMPSIKYDVPVIARLLVGKQNKDLEASHEAWHFLKQYSKQSIQP